MAVKESSNKGAPKNAVNKGGVVPGKFSCKVCGYTRKDSDMSSKPGICIACAASMPVEKEVKE